MLPIFFLIALSLFFPLLWFVTFAYIVFLIATRKQRRNKVIMYEVMQSIDLKREQVHLDYLYFDTAKSFAVDHGVTIAEQGNADSGDTLSVELNIDGKEYQVTFQRRENNETSLLVCVAENAKLNQKRIESVGDILLKDSA